MSWNQLTGHVGTALETQAVLKLQFSGSLQALLPENLRKSQYNGSLLLWAGHLGT